MGSESEYLDIIDDNGNIIGRATREECHQKGLKHKAVALFIVNSNNQVLLQRRSPNKKMWPNMWDLSAGGHIKSGLNSFQAMHNELMEELGLDVEHYNLISIGVSDSENIQGEITNRHRNFYFIYKVDDLDLSSLKLQEDEVVEVQWLDKDDIISRINNNYNGITDKKDAWESLIRYYNSLEEALQIEQI